MGLWLFLSIFAPACWGFTNVLDGALRRHFIQDDYALTFAYAFIRLPLVVGLWAVFGFEFPSMNGAGWGMVFAGMLWTIMFIPYLQALEREETTRVALFLQTLGLFTYLLAYVLLEETLDLHQNLAFILILGGGVLAALKKSKTRWQFSSGFFLTLFACFFWGLSDVLFKAYELYFTEFWPAFSLFLFGSTLTSLPLLLKSSVRKTVKTLPSHMNRTGWLLMLLSVGISVIGSTSFAYALTLGKVALTSVFIQGQTLFVFLFTLILSRFFNWVDPEDLSLHSLLFKGLALLIIGIGLVLLYV